MEKRCTNCGQVYFARWRNEPVELCPECKASLTICAQCGELVQAPADPEQLALFPDFERWRAPRELIATDVDAWYWSLRYRASLAARRRDPFC